MKNGVDFFLFFGGINFTGSAALDEISRLGTKCETKSKESDAEVKSKKRFEPNGTVTVKKNKKSARLFFWWGSCQRGTAFRLGFVAEKMISQRDADGAKKRREGFEGRKGL